MGIFGNKKTVPDERAAMPATGDEMRKLIESTYRYNEWSEHEQIANCELVGVPFVPLGVMPGEFLRVIFDDFVRRNMILIKN